MFNVCVLLATYNGDKYLKVLLDSVLSQKNVSVTIVVRDDGSTDNTLAILEDYSKFCKLVFVNGDHLGPSFGFLDLVKKAPPSDYYAFCDQDDYWLPNKLETACEKLEAFDKQRPSLYCSSLNIVDSDLSLISVKQLNKRRSDFGRFIFPGVAGCTMVFNFSLKQIISRASPNYMRMHDVWAYNVCASLGGAIVMDYDSYILYRQHDSNAVGIKKRTNASSYKTYVEKSRVSKHIESLLACYKEDIIPPFKSLCENLSKSNHSFVSRIKLFFSNKIKFGSFGMNILFKIKILLRKM